MNRAADLLQNLLFAEAGNTSRAHICGEPSANTFLSQRATDTLKPDQADMFWSPYVSAFLNGSQRPDTSPRGPSVKHKEAVNGCRTAATMMHWALASLYICFLEEPCSHFFSWVWHLFPLWCYCLACCDFSVCWSVIVFSKGGRGLSCFYGKSETNWTELQKQHEGFSVWICHCFLKDTSLQIVSFFPRV